MARRLLTNALLLDPEAHAPEPGSILLDGERIEALLRSGEAGPEDAERVDLGGRGLAPGFIDLHYHGRFVFQQPDAYAASLADSSRTLLAHGTTAYLPTTVAWPRAELARRVEALTRVIASAGAAGSVPLGLHLEGPWIRPEAAGAQPLGGIRPYLAREAAELFDSSQGMIKMVTYAPEASGAAELEAELGRRGILASMGHSLADDACVMRSVERGVARHVTHLFNAMGGLHHRDRGLAGVALTEDRLTCDLICDGVHVHPGVVRMTARAKGENLILITDRLEPPPGGGFLQGAGFGTGGLSESGEAWRLPDGTLAGSSLTLDRALANVRSWGAMTQLEAVAAATLRPARQLGIESERGTLRPGARADLVLLGSDGRVEQTWLGGLLAR